jgi:hypothetical protein
MEHLPELAARDAVNQLFEGEQPAKALPESCGSYAEVIGEMARALNESGQDAVHKVFETYARYDANIAALRAASQDSYEHPSPLPTEMTQDLELGWVGEYADVASKLTGSPHEFNRLNGMVAAATALQRNAYLPMSFGTIHSNIYALIVARSSVYHKSTSLKKVGEILTCAGLEHLLLSEHHTSEGLVSELAEQEAGVVVQDEMGRLMGSDKVRYTQHLKQDLMALYDGERIRRRLSNEKVQVENPYLNILGATTPQRFFGSVTHGDWQDGFLPRWLFVLPECAPNFDSETSLLDQEQKQAFEKLAQPLRSVSQQTRTAFSFTGQAHRMWHEWQKASVIAAYHYNDDSVAAVVTRYNTYALKFAMILAAVNGTWGQISPEVMQTAIDLADNHKVYVRRILDDRISFGVNGAKLQRIHEVVRKFDDGTGVTTKDILQNTRIPSAELKPCIAKLLEYGALMEVPAKRGKRFAAVSDRLPIRKW